LGTLLLRLKVNLNPLYNRGVFNNTGQHMMAQDYAR
jgi:hypothetical protein